MKSEAQKKATAKYREKGMRLTIEFFPGTEKELIDHLNNQPKKATVILEKYASEGKNQKELSVK
jgi:hypothetical protein